MTENSEESKVESTEAANVTELCFSPHEVRLLFHFISFWSVKTFPFNYLKLMISPPFLCCTGTKSDYWFLKWANSGV